jgi:cytochrome o ubiquinol oxidase subunit 2
MKILKDPVFSMLIFSGILLLLILLMQPLHIYQYGDLISVLFPKGWVGVEQRNLLLVVQILMLLVIVPVYILTFVFSWIYRADNPKGKYDPNLTDNFTAECFWWGIPIVMVAIVSVLVWVKTYELDPYKSLEGKNKEMTIQVVSLRWKWLFIYPEEKIASINFFQIPKDTPIRFELSADSPMNSFWLPSLGGQIYCMPAMTTLLNLIANETGDFRGSSANISGEGFSGMTFIARASSKQEYDQWVKDMQKAPRELDADEYEKLLIPSEYEPTQLFQLKDEKLFESIVNKYMHPRNKE